MPDNSDQIVLLTNNQLIEQVDFLSVEDEYNYSENWIASLKEIATSINLSILTPAVNPVDLNLGDFSYAA